MLKTTWTIWTSRYGLVWLAGVLMGLAPVNAWPLAWVTLAPLWWAVGATAARGLTRRRQGVELLGLTACWSLGYHGTALSWILHLHPLTWMGMSWAGSVAIAAFAWAAITLWGMGLVCLWALGLAVASRVGLGAVGRVLTGTALWCGLEALWNLGPLDWTTLGWTQSPHNLAILHLGQVSGPLTVSAALVAVNGLLAEGVRWRAGGESRFDFRWDFGCWAIALALLAHTTGYALYAQPLADVPEQALQVGIVQGNIPTRIKLSAEGNRQAQERYLQGYRQLAAQGADAVLTPEGALPTIWNPQRQAIDLFVQTVQAQTDGPMLWLGRFALLPDRRDRITQSLFALSPAVGIAGRYDKVKLVPLGEYVPLQDVFRGLISRLSPIGTDMIAGRTDQVFDSGVGPAAVGICFDSAFSGLFRAQVAQGAQFILTSSNIDPYPLRTMRQHQAHDVMRAIETSRWAVRATNTGLSSVVDPHGRVVWTAEPDRLVVHAEQIFRRQHKTLYVRWGNWLTPLLVGLALLKLGQKGILHRLGQKGIFHLLH